MMALEEVYFKIRFLATGPVVIYPFSFADPTLPYYRCAGQDTAVLAAHLGCLNSIFAIVIVVAIRSDVKDRDM